MSHYCTVSWSSPHNSTRLTSEIVRSLAALAKVCVVRLSPDSVHFIVPGNEGRDGVQVWS